ncbi:hypothetical protein [Effusibacillus pohliae]|uniref:hypothetical protein n=1 Tax=Effusibacillus pohliae TaxID=232270 RepID=UPI000376EE4D|nr:hypothetical protein [Effusibacillus pohliae]
MLLRRVQTIVTNAYEKLGWYGTTCRDEKTAEEIVGTLRQLGYEVRTEKESGVWKIRFQRRSR